MKDVIQGINDSYEMIQVRAAVPFNEILLKNTSNK